MTIFYQLIGFLGTAVFLLSFQFKSNKVLFRMQLAAYLLYSLHMLLIGAYTGAATYLISIARSYFMQSKWRITRGWGACAVLCAMQVLALLFTWGGWVSVLPVVANVITNIACYSNNALTIRKAMIFGNSPLFLVYNIIVGSWAGTIDELITIGSAVFSIARFGWKELDKTQE